MFLPLSIRYRCSSVSFNSNLLDLDTTTDLAPLSLFSFPGAASFPDPALQTITLLDEPITPSTGTGNSSSSTYT